MSRRVGKRTTTTIPLPADPVVAEWVRTSSRAMRRRYRTLVARRGMQPEEAAYILMNQMKEPG